MTAYLVRVFMSLMYLSRHEKDRDWKEATRRYKEVLEYDADHAEACDRMHQIRMIMSQQVSLLLAWLG